MKNSHTEKKTGQKINVRSKKVLSTPVDTWSLHFSKAVFHTESEYDVQFSEED